MTQKIFKLLKEISLKGAVTLEKRETINRDQAIADDERYDKLKYLLSQGLVSNINDTFIITEYGYSVAQFDNWNEYLIFQKEVIDKKIKKERFDLKISEFQVKTKLLPYFISVVSIVLSAIALFYPDLIRKGKTDRPSTESNTPINYKPQDKSLAADTFQTSMERSIHIVDTSIVRISSN